MTNTRQKQMRRGQAKRLRRLVDEAGGQAAFCRKVWPREKDPAEGNKAKVSKWCSGRSSIDAMQAEVVAEAFGYRPAWLVFGEEPERAAVSRPSATLEDDLRAEVMARISLTRDAYPDWVRVGIDRKITGERLLGVIASMVDREYKANAVWMLHTHSVGLAVIFLASLSLDDEASQTNLEQTRDGLTQIYDTMPPPIGEVIIWEKQAVATIAALSAPEARSEEQGSQDGATGNGPELHAAKPLVRRGGPRKFRDLVRETMSPEARTDGLMARWREQIAESRLTGVAARRMTLHLSQRAALHDLFERNPNATEEQATAVLDAVFAQWETEAWPK